MDNLRQPYWTVTIEQQGVTTYRVPQDQCVRFSYVVEKDRAWQAEVEFFDPDLDSLLARFITARASTLKSDAAVRVEFGWRLADGTLDTISYTGIVTECSPDVHPNGTKLVVIIQTASSVSQSLVPATGGVQPSTPGQEVVRYFLTTAPDGVTDWTPPLIDEENWVQCLPIANNNQPLTADKTPALKVLREKVLPLLVPADETKRKFPVVLVERQENGKAKFSLRLMGLGEVIAAYRIGINSDVMEFSLQDVSKFADQYGADGEIVGVDSNGKVITADGDGVGKGTQNAYVGRGFDRDVQTLLQRRQNLAARAQLFGFYANIRVVGNLQINMGERIDIQINKGNTLITQGGFLDPLQQSVAVSNRPESVTLRDFSTPFQAVAGTYTVWKYEHIIEGGTFTTSMTILKGHPLPRVNAGSTPNETQNRSEATPKEMTKTVRVGNKIL